MAPGAGLRYPVPAPKKRSIGKILALVFGGVFLLVAGGCGLFIWSFRDEIVDATIDFSDAVVVDDPASCAVTGVDFGEDYEIDATLTATSAQADAHYLVGIRVVGADGAVLGVEDAVFRSMAPSEQRTEGVFNTISAREPVESVSCEVTEVARVPVGG